MIVSMDKKYVTRNGLYNAKVVYIHDKGCCPVVVFAEDKRDGVAHTRQAFLDGKYLNDGSEHDFDLIEVPEERTEMLIRVVAHVKFTDSEHWLVNNKVFYSKPTLEQIEDAYSTESKPVLTLEDYRAAYDKAWWDARGRQKLKPFFTEAGGRQSGIKAVLELAGVKVL